MPEFSYYYTEYFLKYVSQDKEYQNLSLSIKQSVSLFTFDAEGYVIDMPTTLAHPINMDRLIRSCSNFESSGNINDFMATIQVTVDGKIYAAINNNNGTWSLPDNTIQQLAKGTYSVSVNAMEVPQKCRIRQVAFWCSPR